MMANGEKMGQKQEGRKHNLKVFVIMILLLIVSLLGLIVFSRENFKESVKEYFAVKYLESNEKLVFRNKNRNKISQQRSRFPEGIQDISGSKGSFCLPEICASPGPIRKRAAFIPWVERDSALSC